MKIQMNRAMRGALDKYGISDILELNLENGNIFQEIIAAGISVDKGCLLLNRNLTLCKGLEIKDFPDLTGYECYINKINVDDYLPTSDPKELLQSSLILARLLDRQLTEFGEKVEIIIGLQADDVPTSAVRFHKVRGNESWLGTNLEKYDECILVAETN